MKNKSNKKLQKRGGKNKTKRSEIGGKNSKKWLTAIDSAQKTLNKTGSLNKARKALRSQALSNARKLFGSIGKI